MRCTRGLLLVFLTLGSMPAQAVERLIVIQEIMHDSNAPPARTDDFLDTTFLVQWKQSHAALTFGSFSPGAEVGGFLRDARQSAYGATLRRRMEGLVQDTSLELETDQKLGRTVGLLSVRCIWPDHPESDGFLVSPVVGAEFYYGDHSFLALRAVHDPRPGTGTAMRIANRLGRERGHVEVAVAPRSDGVVGWSFGVRWRQFLAGLARDRDFDFTRIDRVVLSFGFHYDLNP